MRTAASAQTVLVALLLSAGPVSAVAQSPTVAAPDLTAAQIAGLCRELEAWFTNEAARNTASVRTGGVDAMRQYHEEFYSDSAALVIKGSNNWFFHSRTALIDSLSRTPSELAPDRFFEYRPVATSVALITSRRALFVQRYLEIDSATVARGMTRVYSGMKAGTVVHTVGGWRLLERVNSTGSLGTIDSTTSRVRAWQCR